MKEWLIIQSLIDVFLFVFIVWFALNQSRRSSRLEKKHRSIKESLRELLENSKRFSGQVQEGKTICESLLGALDQKTGEFEELVSRAQKLSDSLKPEKSADSQTPREDKYKLVEKLADRGMSRDEIVHVTGVLKGEVDLILNLSSK